MDTLILDEKLFSGIAIKRTAYDLSDVATFNLNSDNNGNFLVEIIPIKCNESDEILRKFRAYVLDHQLRIEINNECRGLREVILAQAFSPCDNLDDLLK